LNHTEVIAYSGQRFTACAVVYLTVQVSAASESSNMTVARTVSTPAVSVCQYF